MACVEKKTTTGTLKRPSAKKLVQNTHKNDQDKTPEFMNRINAKPRDALTPCEREKKSLELDWACYDMVQQKKDAEVKYALEVEKLFLTCMVLAEKFIEYSYAKSSEIVDIPDVHELFRNQKKWFETASLGHVCNYDCNHTSMEKGKMFQDPVTRHGCYIATGDVFVCPISGFVHICDISCNAQIKSTREEAFVCRITGRTKSFVVSTGGLAGLRGGVVDEIGVDVAADEDVDDMDVLAQDAPVVIEDPDAEEVIMPYGENVWDAENRNKKNRRKRASDFDALSPKKHSPRKKSSNSTLNAGKASKCTSKCPNPFAADINECREYDENMALVRHKCELLLQPTHIRKIRDDSLNNWERMADQHISAYVQLCKKTGITPDYIQMAALHSDILVPRIFALSPTFRDKCLTREEIDQHSQRVMGYWGILTKSPHASKNKLNFKDFCVAILYKMNEGYSLDVYVDEDGVVHRIPLKNQKGEMKKVTVEFIPKYDIDPVPKQSISKLYMEEEEKRSGSHTAHAQHTSAKLARWKKGGTGGRNAKKKKKKSALGSGKHKTPNIIDIFGVMNQCYTSIIDTKPKLEELDNYMLKELPALHSRMFGVNMCS